MSGNGEAERREYLFRNGARHALLLADSEVGAEGIMASYRAYGVTRDRVAVVPYLPPPYLLAQRPTAADVQRVRAA